MRTRLAYSSAVPARTAAAAAARTHLLPPCRTHCTRALASRISSFAAGVPACTHRAYLLWCRTRARARTAVAHLRCTYALHTRRRTYHHTRPTHHTHTRPTPHAHAHTPLHTPHTHTRFLRTGSRGWTWLPRYYRDHYLLRVGSFCSVGYSGMVDLTPRLAYNLRAQAEHSPHQLLHYTRITAAQLLCLDVRHAAVRKVLPRRGTHVATPLPTPFALPVPDCSHAHSHPVPPPHCPPVANLRPIACATCHLPCSFFHTLPRLPTAYGRGHLHCLPAPRHCPTRTFWFVTTRHATRATRDTHLAGRPHTHAFNRSPTFDIDPPTLVPHSTHVWWQDCVTCACQHLPVCPGSHPQPLATRRLGSTGTCTPFVRVWVACGTYSSSEPPSGYTPHCRGTPPRISPTFTFLPAFRFTIRFILPTCHTTRTPHALHLPALPTPHLPHTPIATFTTHFPPSTWDLNLGLPCNLPHPHPHPRPFPCL